MNSRGGLLSAAIRQDLLNHQNGLLQAQGAQMSALNQFYGLGSFQNANALGGYNSKPTCEMREDLNKWLDDWKGE
jgi:hypothetical protein